MKGRSRPNSRFVVRRRSVVVLVMLLTAVLATWGEPGEDGGTAGEGRAQGYSASVGLFGGAAMLRGPAGDTGCNPSGPVPGPGGTTTEACNITAELPADGGSDTANSVGAIARYGPAIIFSHGGAQLDTQGSLGTR